MGLLDSVIGVLSGARTGAGSGDMLTTVLRLLADDGEGPGLAEIRDRFAEGGLAATFESWVGRGGNIPIEPEELQRVLGTELVEDIAHQLGMSTRHTAERLAQMLPYVVDKLTPGGRIPESGLGDCGQLMGRMAGR